jgi:hypothetical protein
MEYEFMNQTFHVGIEQPRSNDEKTVKSAVRALSLRLEKIRGGAIKNR